MFRVARCALQGRRALKVTFEIRGQTRTHPLEEALKIYEKHLREDHSVTNSTRDLMNNLKKLSQKDYGINQNSGKL